MLSPLVGYSATAIGHLAAFEGAIFQGRAIAAAEALLATSLAEIAGPIAGPGAARGKRSGVTLRADPESSAWSTSSGPLGTTHSRLLRVLALGHGDDSDLRLGEASGRGFRVRELESARRSTVARAGRCEPGRPAPEVHSAGGHALRGVGAQGELDRARARSGPA